MSDVLFSSDIQDVKKTAMKLHKQFGYPLSSKLLALIKYFGIAGGDLEKYIIEVREKYETCFDII